MCGCYYLLLICSPHPISLCVCVRVVFCLYVFVVGLLHCRIRVLPVGGVCIFCLSIYSVVTDVCGVCFVGVGLFNFKNQVEHCKHVIHSIY